MAFSNNPEKLSLFGGGCNENDRILDLYGGLDSEVIRKSHPAKPKKAQIGRFGARDCSSCVGYVSI